MTKSTVILSNDKDIQLKWLRNQVKKQNNIFLNEKLALKEFNQNLIGCKVKNKIVPRENIEISPVEVESFVKRYLTETAIKKLINTIRVTNSRTNGKKTLQVEIEHSNDLKLTELMKQSRLSRKALINKLIENAIWHEPNQEEQLEIKL